MIQRHGTANAGPRAVHKGIARSGSPHNSCPAQLPQASTRKAPHINPGQIRHVTYALYAPSNALDDRKFPLPPQKKSGSRARPAGLPARDKRTNWVMSWRFIDLRWQGSQANGAAKGIRRLFGGERVPVVNAWTRQAPPSRWPAYQPRIDLFASINQSARA